jgi:FG-GAP-like repeat/Dockerin type I domain
MIAMNTSTTTRILTAAAAGMLTGIASAAITISPAVSVLAGTQPDGIAAADLDGDGDNDLAVTIDAPDRLIVLLNNGTGTFSAGPVTFLPASSSPGEIVTGKLDGDADIDLMVALKDNDTVIALLNNGAGTFTLGAQFATGFEPRGLSGADINGDGFVDVSTANRSGDNASVLRSTGAAAFASQTVAVGTDPRGSAFGSFDADGDIDLAVTNHDSSSISILSNSGGSFAVTATLAVPGGTRPEGIAAGDLDGDGDIDLAVATNGNGLNRLSIYLNAGGTFAAPVHYPTGGVDPSEVALGDMDCDGDLDAAVLNDTTGNVSVMENLGAAVFGPATLMAAGGDVQEIVAADLDGDGAGDSDLAVTNQVANNVSVFINQTCEATPADPADLNGDGVVNGFDLAILLAAWGRCPAPPAGCPADLNGNGTVNGIDLAILLGSWG